MIHYDSASPQKNYEISGTSPQEKVALRTNNKGYISATRFLHNVMS